MKHVNKLLSISICVSLLAACAGRPANPVMVDQVGDNRRTCLSIETEMKAIEVELRRLIPETDKTGKNVALGVAGALFIVPLFFMDLGESEKIEVNAYRQRYNRLNILSVDKDCDFSKVTPDNSKK
jgi:hypothetical protein